MLQTNLGDREFFPSQLHPFSVSQVVCIYICLAGMNFAFDKGHVAHKGSHDHINPQGFVNKQG